MPRFYWIAVALMIATMAWGEESFPPMKIPAGESSTLNTNTLRFSISKFQIEGNTLASNERPQPTVKPMLGDARDFETIQQASAAIYGIYKQVGYQTVRVIIPEQSIQEGVIKLHIMFRNSSMRGRWYE